MQRLAFPDARREPCRRISRWRSPPMSSTAASWSRCCWSPGCRLRAGAAPALAAVLPGRGCARPVRGGDAGGVESLCRRTPFAGALRPAGRLRVSAVGGGDGAQDAVVRGPRRYGWRSAGWRSLRRSRGYAYGPDAGRDGGGGLLPCARSRSATDAVRDRRNRRGGSRGAAVVDRSGRVRFAVVVTPRVSAFAARAEPGLPRWAAWPVSAASGTVRPYPPPDNAFRGGGRRRAAWRGGCGPAGRGPQGLRRFRCSFLPPPPWWCPR